MVCVNRSTFKKLFVRIFLIGGILMMSGCISLKQGTDEFKASGDAFGFGDGYGLLTINHQKQPITVIDNESYALSPKGKKIGVRTKPHEYDLEQKQFNPRIRVDFIDSSGNTLTNLSNGKWRFHFKFVKEDQTQGSQDFEFNVTTFYYNPIIDGPPN